MTVHKVRCLNCYHVDHVNFTAMGHATCPQCGAPGIKLLKIDINSRDPNDPFERQMRQQ